MTQVKLCDYQREAVCELNQGKHICIAWTGMGKSAISLHWARDTGQKKWLVVGTATARDSGQWPAEVAKWFGERYLEEEGVALEVISWAGLNKWVGSHWKTLDEYAVIFDELHCAKRGISTQRGKAFLKVARNMKYWTGYTATPGNNWMDFYAYFAACGHVRNKTEFERRFCHIVRYKGYPELLGFCNTDVLENWWADMIVAPDASEAMKQLPGEYHEVVEFGLPPHYRKVENGHETLEGEILQTFIAYRHYLRQMCGAGAPKKLEWLESFIGGLGQRVVVFFTYKAEREALEKCAKKALKSLGKCARVWVIDGQHHDIPTEERTGEADVILVQWTSGAASLNLQFCHYWVSFSPSESYITSVQGRGRVKRIGQTEFMRFYYLKCVGTIEDDIYKSLAEGKDFADSVWCNKYKKGYDEDELQNL